MAKSESKPLIIHELIVKNVGPIKEIEVKPKGDVVEFTGPNGAGKSTVLDAISYALSGARSFSDIPKVVRDDEDEAEILVDLGEYKVIREWHGEHNYKLKVLAKLEDGTETQLSAPQSVLDTFGETIGVDPLELANKDNSDKRKEFLESFVDLDLDRLEHEYKQVYNKRTDVNRDVRNAKTRKDGLDPVPEELPEKVDVSEASKELQEAERHNNNIEKAGQKKAAVRKEKKKLEGQAENIEEEIEFLKKKLKAQEQKLKSTKDEVAEKEHKIGEIEEWLENNERVDTQPIEEKIAKAENISEKHQLAKRHEELKAEITAGEEKSEQLTEELEEIESRKLKAIKEAELPLDGLNIEDSDVTINGQAFLQYSEGERLKYAALMIVGSNPRFRVIPIKEGEKLDSKNMATLKEVCREHGFQLWIEKMDETGEVGFVMEGGEIVKNNQKS